MQTPLQEQNHWQLELLAGGIDARFPKRLVAMHHQKTRFPKIVGKRAFIMKYNFYTQPPYSTG